MLKFGRQKEQQSGDTTWKARGLYRKDAEFAEKFFSNGVANG
jgi:hypothetical protein